MLLFAQIWRALREKKTNYRYVVLISVKPCFEFIKVSIHFTNELFLFFSQARTTASTQGKFKIVLTSIRACEKYF